MKKMMILCAGIMVMAFRFTGDVFAQEAEEMTPVKASEEKPSEEKEEKKKATEEKAEEKAAEEKAEEEKPAEEKPAEEKAAEEKAEEEKAPEEKAEEEKPVEEKAEEKPTEEKAEEEKPVEEKAEEKPAEEKAEEEKAEEKPAEEKSEEEKPEEEKAEEEKEEGLEEGFTLSEEERGFRGNWVKKKEWLIRAREKNNKMQNLLAEIQKSREPFVATYFEIEGELDVFFKELGAGEQKLNDLFASIEKYLQKAKAEKIGYLRERELAGEKLTPKERETKENAEEDAQIFEKEYKTFKDDLTMIVKLDDALEERLKKLDEQIRVAIDEVQSARAKYEAIWEIIDDVKAEANYREVHNSWKKVKSISDFIAQEFKANFDLAVTTVKDKVAEARDRIQQLEKKGLIIKNRQERLKEIKEAERAKPDKAAQLREKRRREALPWYQSAMEGTLRVVALPITLLRWTWENVVSFLRSISQKVMGLFGVRAPVEKPKEKPEEKPQEAPQEAPKEESKKPDEQEEPSKEAQAQPEKKAEKAAE